MTRVHQDLSALDLDSALPSLPVKQLDESSGTVADLERENEGFQSRTRTDSLTGLPNLAMLDWFLSHQVQLRMREELPGYLGVVMLDIHRLNRFNDMIGREAGDQVVRSVAAALEQAARESDFLVRHSGGTFCLVVSHATPDSLTRAGKRLRASVKRREIDLGDMGKWKVNVSFGCAWLPDVRGPGDPVVKLLAAADEQLHQAKTHGGKRVAVAAESIPSR